jgi:glutamate/tyrosine decarboxylase-like PLP-dependent enzyme
VSAQPQNYDAALDRASAHVREWLASMPQRRVPASATADEVGATLGETIPDGPSSPESVIDLLADAVEPGLLASPSGRFYGWVIGGTLPAALAADWLVSAWDQNAGMRNATTGVVAAEEVAARWLLDLLGLPPTADVGFVTGATMASFTGLAAGRHHVLSTVGWDLNANGLTGAPPIRVIVGAERHATIDLALRYLGLGAPTAVAADEQGRIRIDALAAELANGSGPTIVCLQAGNLHSGAFDLLGEATDLSHDYGAWVHVDGAFGLWAAASPTHRYLTVGVETADSWATDAHKTLNAPYDCGLAIVADSAALRAVFGTHPSYLITADPGPGDPFERAPELSRRARGVPVYAALRSLGRSGVAALVDTLVSNAQELAAGIAQIEGAQILNNVDFTQVCVSFGDDERTREVTRRLLQDGVVWMSGSQWKGRDVLRISVSNWSTDDNDVRVSIDAVRRAAAR